MTRNHAHDCPHGHRTPNEDPYPRRHVLAGAGAAAAIGLAGCLGGDEADEPPAEPIALTDGQACDVCGMVIEDHFGPAGQLFYADGKPEDRDGPARFDSLTELVAYHEERLARGWELRAAFVTDYASVDYDLEERDGTTYVTSHVGADAFADATGLAYVANSDVQGAMGPDLLPFSDRDAASAFADDHGGELREWDDLV